MSSTIGFGLSTTATNVVELGDHVLKLASSYGYYVSSDLGVVESDVTEGIQALVDLLDLKSLFLLHSPPRPAVALAFDIVKEMRMAVYEAGPPPFICFLEELSRLLATWVSEFTVFFASQWYTDLRFRRAEGSVADLTELLRKSGGWYLLLFDPKRNAWHEFDEFPLVFTVKLDADNSVTSAGNTI